MLHNSDHPVVVEDDISILSTPYLPQIEMARAIKSRVQIREEKIHDLDMKIQELCAQRDALRRTNAVAHTLLAPIRKPPPEILAEIFILCIPVLCDYDFKLRDYGDNYPVDMCQYLGEVCHRWKDILDDTPRAWTSLVLTSPRPDISVIRSYLQKSKSFPLDIYFDPNESQARAFGQSDPADLRPVMRLLRGEVNRIRHFIADLSHTDQCGLLRELFPCGESSNTSIMEAFRVRTNAHYGSNGSMGDVLSPKLQSLDVWGKFLPLRSFSASSLSSLRRLRLNLQMLSRTRNGALSFLEYCPQLEALHCSGSLEPYLWSTRREDKISLPSLKKISLVSLRNDDAQNLMESLHVPLLDTIRFDLLKVQGRSRSVSDLLDCLSPVPVLLQRLTLSSESLDGDDRQWLSRFENIRFLEIGGDHSFLQVDSIIVSALTPPPFTPLNTWVCPNLEELVLKNIAVPGDELVRLAYGRTQPDSEERLPGYLNCLELFHCSGLRPIHIEELSRLNRKSLRFTDIPDDGWTRGWPISVSGWGTSESEDDHELEN